MNVPCLPLLQRIIDSTALLDIDLFSLDVEGSEQIVFETVDLSRTNVRIFIVELDGFNPDKYTWVMNHLLSHGFRPVSISLENSCNPVFQMAKRTRDSSLIEFR